MLMRLALAAALWLFSTGFMLAQPARTRPPQSGAVLIEWEGRVLALTAKTPAWTPAQTNQVLAARDRLRTREYSRATLLWSDQSTLRLGELSEIQIEPAPVTSSGRLPGLNLLSGLLYFLHRDRPTQVRFRTPTASAAIRGTEFTLSVDQAGRTVVTVMDGRVELSNVHGQV
jgi:ferric-dicitrate binding protein FerR (iron transport regulator)